MAANGNRLAVFDDEGDGLLTMAGVRYGNGSSNLGMLLKSHVGGQVRQSRMGREGTRIDNAVLSIGVLTQPQTLRQIIAVPGSEGRGLVDRFLIAAPPDRLGSRASVTEEVNPAIKAAFSHLLRSYAITLWDWEDFVVLRLSEDGTSALQEFSQRVEDRLGEDGDLRALGGFGGKLVGSAARLAALHHLAHYGPAAAFSVGINAASVQWGIAVAEWSVEHYSYAVQAAGGVGDVSDASRLLKWIVNRQDKKAILQLREVQRLSPLRNHDQADAALKVLADHHWIRPAKEVRKGYSKDTKTWEVHPNLLA
jgi:hypothetical protein